jgi:hypothetical protein
MKQVPQPPLAIFIFLIFSEKKSLKFWPRRGDKKRGTRYGKKIRHNLQLNLTFTGSLDIWNMQFA